MAISAAAVSLLLALLSLVSITSAEENVCGTWQAFKREKCFQILDEALRTYDDAEKACENASATLVIIHTEEEQRFLTNYLFKATKHVENFWLGGRYSSADSRFHWIDNSEVMPGAKYTNWTKVPKNRTDTCMQIQAEEDYQGGWVDELCAQRKLVVCQRMPSWSMEKVMRELIDAKRELKQVQQNLFPIGYIYTQLPNQKTPLELFAWMTWTEVSSDYADVFFRVTGGKGAQFGTVQQENVPVIDRVGVDFGINEASRPGEAVVKDDIIFGVDLANASNGGGWSKNLYTGGNFWLYNNSVYTEYRVYHRYHTRWGEMRPRNMAIRLWKRTA